MRPCVNSALIERRAGRGSPDPAETVLTRQGKPWIVSRAMSHDRDAEIRSEAKGRSETVIDPHRADESSVSLIGETVAWARAHFERVFQTALGRLAFVDGKKVPEDYVLKEGQVLEFAEEDEDEVWATEL